MEFVIFVNNEHAFTLVKLKTTGHGGEVYKRLLRKSKRSFILSRGWMAHAKQIFVNELKVCYKWILHLYCIFSPR